MSKKEVNFFGILANVDSSILNVKLEHGFEIKSLSFNEGINFFATIESIPHREMTKKLVSPYLNLSEDRIYFIQNSIKEFEKDENGRSSPFNFDPLVHSYLIDFLQKMRLFKKGNICMPSYYYRRLENDKPKGRSSISTTLLTVSELYILNNKEISELYKFIKNTKLPFEKSYLQLAFENFELSYTIKNINLSFLTLMMCLETLFHPGKFGELRYRISRNTAVLLGGENGNSKTIFSEIRRLYDLRSKVVHTGKMNIIKDGDLLLLRHYVRESIKETYRLDKGKDELLEFLNSCGFDRKKLV